MHDSLIRHCSLVSLLLGFALPTFASPHVDLFATLAFRESPFSPHKGLHRVDPALADQRNHYRFEYDGQGRVTAISFRLGGQLRARNHTANYFWYAAAEDYEYPSESLQLVRYRDEHGAPTQVHGGVVTSRYELDGLGRRISLEYLDAENRPTESRWGVARYQWTHQDDGSVIERRFALDGTPVPLRPGFEFDRVRLHYDVIGNVRLMQHLDENGQVTADSTGFAQDRFTISRFGELLRYDVLDEQGQRAAANMQGIASGLQTFTASGYESVSTYLDAAGQPAWNENGWWRSERQYDRFGNLIWNSFRDLEGQPANNPETGYSDAEITWHDDGLRRKALRYFDAQGSPVEHRSRGYHAVLHAYDATGTPLAVALVDRNGNLVEHRQQGWAVRLFSTTETGAPLSEQLTLDEAQAKDLDQLLDAVRRTVLDPQRRPGSSSAPPKPLSR